MVLCAAYCDKEATLDFLAMEDKPSGRYTSDLFSTGTAHIKISTQFPDSGRGVIQRRCQWRCHLPPALTGESTMGDFVPPQILLEKSIVKKCRYLA